MSSLCVVICSTGRSEVLRAQAPALAAQTRAADRVVYVVTKPEDIAFDPTPYFARQTQVDVLISEKGLPRQRNVGLDAIGKSMDIVIFFDDDFIPSSSALAGVEDAFTTYSDVNGMTGLLIADGINNAGIQADEAIAMVAKWDEEHGALSAQRSLRVIRDGLTGLYGCNMAYRISALEGARFDERLPLYAWQEDIDFAARISGRRIKTNAFAGVHQGIKSGRETAGRRLGYSQIANNHYLWRKGTMPARFAVRLALGNFISNHAKALRPEPWIDRKARAFGNWLALADILRGRADPERILTL